MKKITTFALLLIISLTFSQNSPLTPLQVENEITIFTKSKIKKFVLDIEFENVNIALMKKEALEHKTVLSQKQIDGAILNLKKFKLRELFFEKYPAKKSSPFILKKSNRGVNQLCNDGDFENGLPTVNPYVFRSGIVPNTVNPNGVDLVTSGNTLPLITVSNTANNFNSTATVVTAGTDPQYPSQSRTNNNSTKAIKLNKSQIAGRYVTSMSRDFVINSDYFDFNYLLITNNNQDHTRIEQPFFSARIYDLNDPTVILQKIDLVSNVNDCLFTNLSTFANESILTSGWRCARINTKALIGESVRVEFLVGDCQFGVHFGTVYIDDICNSSCTTPAFGSLGLDYKDVAVCPTTTQTVCGTYQLPIQGQNTGIVLNVLKDGAIVGSMPVPTTLTANTFCFNVPVSLFGPNPIGGFEYQVIGSFIRTCTQNFQLDPITVTSVYPIFADVLFWPVKAVNDTLNVSNCSTINTINILANDINVDCPFTATISNVTITQLTTNPNIVLDTTTGIARLVANAPIGSYSINYKITSIVDPSVPTSSATITINKAFSTIAPVDDNYTATAEKPCTDIVFTKHLLNDKLCNLAVSINLIDVKVISLNLSTSSTPISISNITVDVLTGKITIPASLNLASGSYVLTYQICQKSLPTNCKTAKILFTVGASTITLVADNFNSTPINNAIGGTTASVLTNDSFNAAAITTTSGLTTSLVQPVPINATNWITDVTISNTGIVTVPANTAPGYYTLTYKVENCLGFKTSTVKIFVESASILQGNVRANSGIYKIGIQSSGKIIIGGALTSYNNINVKYLARLNTNLTLDTSFFNYFSIFAAGGLQDFKVLSNDKIIVCITSGTPLVSNPGVYVTNRGIERLNSNGTLDTTFNPGGSGFQGESYINCLIQPDGKILVSCAFKTIYNGVNVKNVFRLNANGTLDPSFVIPFIGQPNVIVPGEPITSRPVLKIALQPDGKVLIAGTGSTPNSPPAPAPVAGYQPQLCRVNSNGTLDTSFLSGNTGINNFVGQNNSLLNPCTTCYGPIEDIEILNDGFNSIIIAGSFDSYNGTAVKNIVKLSSNGTPDPNFITAINFSSNKAIVDVEQDYDINLGTTNGLFLAGHFSTFNNAVADRITRLELNGIKTPSFGTGIIPIVGSLSSIDWSNPTLGSYDSKHIRVLKRQPDRKLILGGSFNQYNGINAENITRINPYIVGNQSRGFQNNLNVFEDDSIVKNYPNPFKDKFILDLTGSENDYNELIITNILGEIVHKQAINSRQENEINLTSVTNGYYFAKISNEATSELIKLIKN